MCRICANQRLFVLAEPRSGSSWLMETLRFHPELQLFGEIMNHVENREISKYLGGNANDFHHYLENMEKTFKGQFWKKFLRLRLEKNARFCGCKILLNQLTLIGDEFPAYFFDFYRNALFIFLYRTNVVAQQISLQMAHQYNVWHVKNKKEVTLKQIHVCPPVFVSNLEKSLWLREKIQQLLDAKRLQYYSLSYEQLFEQKDSIFGKIYAFLGITEKRLTWSREIKGNPFHPQMVIENYQEVKSYLRQYPSFLMMLENAYIAEKRIKDS